MSRQNYQDNIDLDDVMSDIMGQQRREFKNKAPGFFKKRFKNAHNTKTAQKPVHDNRKYLESALGVTHEATKDKKSKPKPQNRTIIIQINGFDIRRKLTTFYKRYRHLVVRVFLILLVLALVVGAVLVANHLRGHDEPITEQKATAPDKVYVPPNLPEGFSVGSDSKTLENGVVTYTVYTDKGYAVSITQQAKPTNLDSTLFAGAITFSTRLGQAYIVETPERITGYILTENSMILFNSTGAVDGTSFKKLMESFQPY